MADGSLMDWASLRPGLVRFLAKRIGCASTAEDLTHDVWVRTHAVSSAHDPAAYIFRAAANLATDHLRAERRRSFANDEAMRIVLGSDEALSPETQVQDSEQLALVWDTLQALPARTRQIFGMNRFEGTSYRAIACELNISTTAVEKHMARALDALAGLREQR